MLRREGFNTWLWTVDLRDWRGEATASRISTIATMLPSGDSFSTRLGEHRAPAALTDYRPVALTSIVASVQEKTSKFASSPTGERAATLSVIMIFVSEIHPGGNREP